VIFALLPVKSPKNAKQRLNGFLPAAHRETLARLMYEHTIAALFRARGIDRVVVVTSDNDIAEHARGAGALVFVETQQSSHSLSADRACLRALELGATTVLLVPIDVPLVTAQDFSRLAAAARPGVVVVPSSDGTGTNALVRTPPDVIESCFGPDSFRAHLEQASRKGVTAEVLRLPGLMLDIDTPGDVAELMELAPENRVASFLRSVCASK
jgi:2-phospho-L-lactate/phosphoenolpyruvate guanylyltransferase